MEKARKPPEKIASVRINNGQDAAELVRELDPGGAIVVHPIRRSFYVHETWHRKGKLANELYDAGEKFRKDFERAGLSGNYARLDMFKTRSGQQTMSDSVATAKIRVNKALEAFGNKDAPSLSQSCIWNVIGCGSTLESWTHLIRQAGAGMNADKAAGVLHASLERLAVHYGMINLARATALRQDVAYGRGIRDFFEFMAVWITSTKDADKATLNQLVAAAQKRFAKFTTES